jgi:hypothetical protein
MKKPRPTVDLGRGFFMGVCSGCAPIMVLVVL